MKELSETIYHPFPVYLHSPGQFELCAAAAARFETELTASRIHLSGKSFNNRKLRRPGAKRAARSELRTKCPSQGKTILRRGVANFADTVDYLIEFSPRHRIFSLFVDRGIFRDGSLDHAPGLPARGSQGQVVQNREDVQNGEVIHTTRARDISHRFSETCVMSPFAS